MSDSIFETFAAARNVLPRRELLQAVGDWETIGPALVAVLRQAADGTDRSERTRAILFFGIYLMAQMRETDAFQPICTLAADGEELAQIIDDGLTEDLPAILTRTYDGDPQPLHRLIENADADEYARDAALEALAALAETGRIDRAATATYLRDLFATLQPRENSMLWVGWQSAIAILGLTDLAPLVEDAFQRGYIDESIMGFDDFLADLKAAGEPQSASIHFRGRVHDTSRFDDVVGYLASWDHDIPRSPRAEPSWRPAEPIRNPWRDIGRNDPCPCGSGKKFKKCCLGKGFNA